MVIGKPIVLTLSEREADILQKALREYTGPYGNGPKTLTPEENSREQSMIAEAHAMSDDLCNELMRRSEHDQASRVRQGIAQHGHVDLFNEYQLGEYCRP